MLLKLRPGLDPCAELLTLGVGHASRVAERHDLREHRLLLDLVRITLDLVGRVEHHTLWRFTKISVRRMRRMALDAVLLDDRMDVPEGGAAGRTDARPVAGDHDEHN